ncbi:KptA family-domain-containing protein [Mycena floridula]|nr:KptA family-domain-containing protein [Mycena floridula]
MSHILRHSAQLEGIHIREDGYVRVKDLLAHPKMSDVDLAMLERIVKQDGKQRYHIYLEPGQGWWICANQGHSMINVELDLRPITFDNIPVAIHGTSEKAWENISQHGLSRMNRKHIHMAQGFSEKGVISGMRTNARVLIYVDVSKALGDGIRFFQSRNRVILTPGDATGFLHPRYFSRVERVRKETSAIPGWESKHIPDTSPLFQEEMEPPETVFNEPQSKEEEGKIV